MIGPGTHVFGPFLLELRSELNFSGIFILLAFMNIANRITFWVVLASLAVLIPLSFVSYRATWHVLRKQISLIQTLFTHNIEMNIVRYNTEIETIARMASYEILAEHARNTDDFTELFRRCLKEKESVFGMILAFSPEIRQGAWYLHRNPDPGDAEPVWVDLLARDDLTPVYQRDWFRIPAETGKPHWSKPYRGRSTGVPMITYSMPMRDDEGRFLGVVACDVSLDWLDTLIGEVQLPRSEVAQVFLLARDGTVLADKHWGMLHENIFDVARSRKDPELERAARGMNSGKAGESDYRSPDGRLTGRIVYMPIDDNDGDGIPDWSLAIFVPRQAMWSYAMQVAGPQLSIELLGMILLLIAFRLVAREISMPIEELHSAALTIASGNLDATIPVMKHQDELAELAESFRKMKHDLKNHIASLAEATRLREHMESELRIARRIQMSLVPKHLPDTPFRDCFDLAYFMEPAKLVGGDFYDFFMLDDETLCLVIADVSGKGVPAAILMARTSALFRSFLINGRQLGFAMEHVNRETCMDNDQCMFVTMFAMSVHLSSGACRMVNAGHNPPLIVKVGKSPEFIGHAHGLPVGIDEDGVYGEETFLLEPGDLVYLYTDGVTEAIDTKSELFGEQRMTASLAENENSNCHEILEKIREDISNFTQGAVQSDDITMLAFRRTEK